MPKMVNFGEFLKNLKLAVKQRYQIGQSVSKLLKMSHLNFSILAFSTNFCSIKTSLSGNTVRPQASNNRQNGSFLAFLMHFWIT